MADEKRLTDANELFKQISTLSVVVTGLRSGKGVLNEFMKHYRESVLRIVQEAPTVDAVEVVHGEWEPHPYHPGFVRCSACKERIIRQDMVDEEHFCSNCGAKMDGGSGDG